MDVTLKQIVMELLRDAKSRKFLLVVGYAGFILYSYLNELNLDTLVYLFVLLPVLLFIYMEGKADVVARGGTM